MSNTPLTYVKGFCYYIDKVRRIQAAISPVEDASTFVDCSRDPGKVVFNLSINE